MRNRALKDRENEARGEVHADLKSCQHREVEMVTRGPTDNLRTQHASGFVQLFEQEEIQTPHRFFDLIGDTLPCQLRTGTPDSLLLQSRSVP
jgi:hypothetical protein